ncbi:MAG TPA: hypothetical protein PLE77_04815 [Kiritimatiellia bacterium]|nr:hypothetical protein [Kiritimatiellia bacterium]
MSARYKRALDEEIAALLMPGQDFHWLISDINELGGDRYSIDIQLREDNSLMYYHGTTRLLRLDLKKTGSGIRAKASAAPTYTEHEGSKRQYDAFKQTLTTPRGDQARRSFKEYLKAAASSANARYYANHKEGWWQNRLCIEHGLEWTPSSPWLVVDRECVIGFDGKAEKKEFYEQVLGKYEKIQNDLQRSDVEKWGRIGKGLGDELDILALDRNGNLIAVELKYGGSAKGVYWGPLQVGAYRDAFELVMKDVSSDILRLARQKIQLRLLPESALEILPTKGFQKVRAVLAVGTPNTKSSCWDKLDEVTGKLISSGAIVDRQEVVRLIP